MLARANYACLLALTRSDRCVLALLLVRVDCAVLCCACGAKKAKKFRKAPQQIILSSATRPMTMETRCCNVFFPNYSKKKPAEDTLVPPLWGKRRKTFVFQDYMFTLLFAAEFALSR